MGNRKRQLLRVLKKIRIWFCGPTPLEQYQFGKDCTDKLMEEGRAMGRADADIAAHIYAMSFGTHNVTSLERIFDIGIQDRLVELGFEDPDPY